MTVNEMLTYLLALASLFLLNATIISMLSRSANAQKTLERERAAWAAERDRLLDRIQAPSFTELKTAEIKVIKAQQGQKEPTSLEPV